MKIKITSILMLLTACIWGIKSFAQDTTKADEFKPSGKLWGQVFIDYEVKTHSDSLLRGNTQYSKSPYNTNYNSFDLRRVYVGYDYNFTRKFTAQVLLSHEGNNYDAQGNRTVLIKLANIRWKNAFAGTDVVVGQMATNAYSLLSEQVWAYRSVEKTITDMRGIAASSDFGVSLQGKYKDGQYGYNILATNNSKYSQENNSFKKFSADVFAKFLDKKLVVDLYGDYERYSQPHPYQLSKSMMKVFVAYQSEPITIGVEVFQQAGTNYAYYSLISDTSISDTSDVNVFGFSVFAHAPIIKDKLRVFARFDSFDPDTKYSSNNRYTNNSINGHLKESFITAGLDWTPVTNVHVMPNIWLNNYTDEAANVTGRIKSDYDMDARVTFFWKF
jgi:hypothetical protein